MKSLKKILSILLFISVVFNLKSQDDFTVGSCPQVDCLITCLLKEVSSPEELIGGICNLAQGLQFGDCGQRNFAGMLVNRTLDLTTQYSVNYIDILVEACRCVLNDSEVAARHVAKPDLCRGQRNPLCLVCNFLKELKKRGITLYTPSADGKNLIMHLSDNGCDQDIIKLLIAHYPNINIHKQKNEDPSFLDYSKGQSNLPFLSQAIEQCVPLEIIEGIIKSGHEVNYRYENCDPPLIQAIKIVRKVRVPYERYYDGYCDRGAYLEYDNNYSRDLIKLLLTLGADPNIEDKNGCKALHLTLSQVHNYYSLFLEYGADVNILDSERCNFLQLMIKNQPACYIYEPCRNLMKTYGIDVRSEDFRGNTALHFAARRLNSELDNFPLWEGIIFFLLENGADTEIENEKGEKPRDLSENRKIKWLLRDRQDDYIGWFRLFQNGVKRGLHKMCFID